MVVAVDSAYQLIEVVLENAKQINNVLGIAAGIGMFAMTSQLGLVGKEATADIRSGPAKKCFTRFYIPELIFWLLI